MKKTIITIAMILAVGFVGFNIAQARWGDGNGFGGYGPGNCQGPRWSEKSTEEIQAFEQFREDTRELREQLFEKRRAYFAIIDQENPDKEAAEQVWSEMFDLQTELHKKAEEAGIERGFGKRGRNFAGRFNDTPPCGNRGYGGCRDRSPAN